MTFDASSLQSAMRRLAAQSGKTKRELCETAAKGFVRDVVAITPPASKGVSGTSAKKAGERTIATDVARIFKPASPEVIASLAAQGGSIVEKFGHKGAKALGEVETRVLSRSEMPAWHAARRRADGRVMAINRDATTGLRKRDLRGLDTGVVSKADFNWFVRTLQKAVGILAAGWNAAARHLKVNLPAWVRRHGDSNGAVSVAVTPTTFRLELTNAVGFVENVKGYARRIQKAVDYQAGKMQRQADYLVAKALRAAGW